MEVFTASALCAGYGGVTVIDGLDLGISEGEFAAIIGPNGSGKSTLVKSLTGFLKPLSGSVSFRGREIGRYSKRLLARELASVQQFMPDPLPFRVRDFIAMGRFPHRSLLDIEGRADRLAVDNAMEMTGTSELGDRSIDGLSGGERQMACVARALAQEPKVIILDEPVSHLDIAHGLRIMDVLHRMHSLGVTVIAVLHDINLASEYASRIIALKAGRLFADGPPGKVVDYRTIEGLFDTVCIVRENPLSGKPFTYPVPGHLRKK